MANYKGHIVGGVLLSAAYSTLLFVVPITQFAEAAGVLRGHMALGAVFIIGVLFALFPDVDTNSKGQNIFYGLALGTDILLLWQGYIQAAAYLGLIAMLPIVGKHRGWTHSKPAMFLIPLPIAIIPYLYNQKILPAALVYYGAAVAGYFSHLLFDGLIFKHFRIKGTRYD
jgi:membrane-bound metal-dependent hydrolase YbcI (DUF457 family)